MGIKEQLAAQSRPLSKEEIFSLFTGAEDKLVKPPLETLNEIGAYNLLVDLRDAALTPEQKPFIVKNIDYYRCDASSPQTLVQKIVDHGARSYSSREMMTRWKLFGMTPETEEELFSILKRKYGIDGVVGSIWRPDVPRDWLEKEHIMADFSLNWMNIKGRSVGRVGICSDIHFNYGLTYFRIVIGGIYIDIDSKKEPAHVAEKLESTERWSDSDSNIIEQAIARVYLQTITPSKDPGATSQKITEGATSGKTVYTEVATPSPNPDFQFLLQKIADAEVVSKLGKIEDTLRKQSRV